MCSNIKTFSEVIGCFVDIISLAIPLLIGITVAYFVWRIVDAWIIHAGDEAKVTEGKQVAVIGVIVLVVMMTVWGIVAFIKEGIFG